MLTLFLEVNTAKGVMFNNIHILLKYTTKDI